MKAYPIDEMQSLYPDHTASTDGTEAYYVVIEYMRKACKH